MAGSALRKMFGAVIMSCCLFAKANAQLTWVNVDTGFSPLPRGLHVFKTTDSLDGKPFVAYYAIADLKNKKLFFATDTTSNRRLTPSGFYKKKRPTLTGSEHHFFLFCYQSKFKHRSKGWKNSEL